LLSPSALSRLRSHSILLVLVGCSGTATRDPPAPNDPRDSACGAQFLALEYEPAGTTAGAACIPLPYGVTVNAVGCVPSNINITVGTTLRVSVGGQPGLFQSTGEATISLALLGRGLECVSTEGVCFFVSPPEGCRVTIVQPGTVGQTVELALADTCILRHLDANGNPLSSLTVSRARLRGTMRILVDTTTPSGGPFAADCGVH